MPAPESPAAAAAAAAAPAAAALPGPTAPTLRVTLPELFDHLGTDQLGYAARCQALSGQWVALDVHVVRTHDDSHWMAVDQAGACPDCAPVPVAALQLPGFDPPAGSDLSAPLPLQGRLSYGFAIGADGYASFLRLEQASVAKGA